MRNGICLFPLSLMLTLPAAVAPGAHRTSGYPPVDGWKVYYQIHGAGTPLLIHGGVASTEIFNPIRPELSAKRQVVAVDFQADGRTDGIRRPLSHQAMADDIAGLIRYLGIEKADVMGYSVGGGVALRSAIQHPDLVRKLAVASATFRRDGGRTT